MQMKLDKNLFSHAGSLSYWEGLEGYKEYKTRVKSKLNHGIPFKTTI